MTEHEIDTIIEKMKRGEVYLSGGSTSDTVWSYRFDPKENNFFHSFTDEEWNSHYKIISIAEITSALRMFGESIIRQIR